MIIGELLIGDYWKLLHNVWVEIIDLKSKVRRVLRGNSLVTHVIHKSKMTTMLEFNSTLTEERPELITKKSKCFRWLVGNSLVTNVIHKSKATNVLEFNSILTEVRPEVIALKSKCFKLLAGKSEPCKMIQLKSPINITIEAGSPLL